jgi:predicted DNA-binding WGR domain protein
VSIVRTYRRSDQDGQQRLEYREAWFEAGTGEVVVHHGRVGSTGTTSTETVADDAAGEELVSGFAALCAEDGYAELSAEELTRLEVSYRLKGAAPTTVETGIAGKLRAEVTNQLAWRGLGDVVGERAEPGRIVFEIDTPHRRKAAAEVSAAAKLAGVQASRVTTDL